MENRVSLMERLHSPYLTERDEAMEDTENQNEVFKMLVQENLTLDTYTKWVCWATDDAPARSSVPVTWVFFNGYRFWQLDSADGRHILIGFCPTATENNKWWNTLGTDKEVRGDLVILRWHQPLVCTLGELERELRNWLRAKYIANEPYTFKI